MKNLATLLSLALCLGAHKLSAQTLIPFDDPAWEFTGEFEQLTYLGQKALLLKGGSAYLPDVSFENGIIEFDVAFPADRGFFGAIFRAQDEKNYEEFYLRPHQSGKPDAMQYTPVFGGLSGWQLYHGPGHSTAYTYTYDRWLHVKLVISGQEMEVYMDDMSKPVLHAFDLKREQMAGNLGVYAFLTQPYFANFSFQEMDAPQIQSLAPKIPALPAEQIIEWSVSEAFPADRLENLGQLPKNWEETYDWETFMVDRMGTLNLGQRDIKTDEKNTVLAKIDISSDATELRKLTFGYSDEVLVYLNGQLLYGGQRKFRSRDFRYLGTIGDFDCLYLPLKKGNNRLVFAVTENFGGWGIRAKLEQEGLQP